MGKNKNHTKTIEDTLEPLKAAVSQVGLTAMLLATLFSLADFAEREGHRAVAALTPQPVYVSANNIENTGNTPGEQNIVEFRRSGKEEIHHTSASYGTVRRSHSVTGRL